MQVVASEPFRTVVTLQANGGAAGRVDLWPVARAVEQRVRELGGPESTMYRPPVQGVLRHSTTYTWHWAGDQSDVLSLAVRDVIDGDSKLHEVGAEVVVQGRHAEVLAPPPPPPELTLEELEAEAFGLTGR